MKAVGIGRISIDPGDESGPEPRDCYELRPPGVLVVENLRNLEAVPMISSFIVLPLRLRGRTGSPIRAISRVPSD